MLLDFKRLLASIDDTCALDPAGFIDADDELSGCEGWEGLCGELQHMAYAAGQFLNVLEGLAPPSVNAIVAAAEAEEDDEEEEDAADEDEDADDADAGPLAALDRQLAPLRRQAFERLSDADLAYHERVALVRLTVEAMLEQADRFADLDPQGWHPDGHTDRPKDTESFADAQQGMAAVSRIARTELDYLENVSSFAVEHLCADPEALACVRQCCLAMPPVTAIIAAAAQPGDAWSGEPLLELADADEPAAVLCS